MPSVELGGLNPCGEVLSLDRPDRPGSPNGKEHRSLLGPHRACAQDLVRPLVLRG